jgi:hypothetical protein
MLSRRKPTKPSDSDLALPATDDLTLKLEGWRSQQMDLYGEAHPAATVTVTVLAATGLTSPDLYWVATCAGSAASTGPSTHYETGLESAPRGAPSWSSEPLALDVHDVTSDLVLFLCDASPHDGSRRCVGRVVVPLCDFLPPLFSCAGMVFGSAPAQQQLWSAIVSPGPGYHPNGAHPLLSSAVPGVAGAGLVEPGNIIRMRADSEAAGDAATPLVHGAALLRVDFALESSLPRALLGAPPFDPALVLSVDGATGVRLIPPQRALLVIHRLASALRGPPALVRLLATRPWTAGLVIAALSFWLCFGMSLALFPWWLALLWVANGVAIRQLATVPTPWETRSPAAKPRSGRPHGGRHEEEPAVVPAATLPADQRCAALEATLDPILTSIEATASWLERAAHVPALLEPRSSTLALALLLPLVSLASAALGALSLLVGLVGGAASFVFLAICVALLLNAATFHRDEIYAWLGSNGALERLQGEDEDEVESGDWAPGRRDRHIQQQQQQQQPAVRFGLDDPIPAAPPTVFNDATDVLASSWTSLWRRAVDAVVNVCARVPDAPTAISRAIARAGQSPDTRVTS